MHRGPFTPVSFVTLCSTEQTTSAVTLEQYQAGDGTLEATRQCPSSGTVEEKSNLTQLCPH